MRSNRPQVDIGLLEPWIRCIWVLWSLRDWQEYIPAYLLRGLIPAALLQSHDFWQNTGPSCRPAAAATAQNRKIPRGIHVYVYVGSDRYKYMCIHIYVCVDPLMSVYMSVYVYCASVIAGYLHYILVFACL